MKERQTASLNNSACRVQSPEPNLTAEKHNASILVTTQKKELHEKAKDDFELRDASVEVVEQQKENEKTVEKEKNYEDCTDLVLVDNKDEEKQGATEEKSLSPDARDKLQATRPGTSPVV